MTASLPRCLLPLPLIRRAEITFYFFYLLLCYGCAFTVIRSHTTVSTLTLSLPRHHLKTNNNNAKFEILTPFFVLALINIWKDICENNIKSRSVYILKNILFAGMCVDFSAQKLYGLGQWKGIMSAHHSTGGHGIFNVPKGLSAWCAHEG